MNETKTVPCACTNAVNDFSNMDGCANLDFSAPKDLSTDGDYLYRDGEKLYKIINVHKHSYGETPRYEVIVKFESIGTIMYTGQLTFNCKSDEPFLKRLEQ